MVFCLSVLAEILGQVYSQGQGDANSSHLGKHQSKINVSAGVSHVG